MRAPDVSCRHANCVIEPGVVAASQAPAAVSAVRHLWPPLAQAYVASDMTTPTVTETFIPLEPVTRDAFADSRPSPREHVPRTQRELVILSLLRCPRLAAERRRS
jgi:hypothetical protein